VNQTLTVSGIKDPLSARVVVLPVIHIFMACRGARAARSGRAPIWGREIVSRAKKFEKSAAKPKENTTLSAIRCKQRHLRATDTENDTVLVEQTRAIMRTILPPSHRSAAGRAPQTVSLAAGPRAARKVPLRRARAGARNRSSVEGSGDRVHPPQGETGRVHSVFLD